MHEVTYLELLKSYFSSFLCESQLFEHMVMFHAPSDGKVLHCNVAGCSSSQMLRGSFIVHLQEVHFSCSSSTGYWKIEVKMVIKSFVIIVLLYHHHYYK